MKKILFGLLCLFLACSIKATVYYWDPEGTATPTASNVGVAWTSSGAQWATTSAQTASPVAWANSAAMCFCAGSNAISGSFTVPVDFSPTVAGLFNGGLTGGPLGCSVTLGGTGTLVLSNTDCAFDTAGGVATTIKIPLTGAGRVAFEGSAPEYFYATNTYTGGTIFGYPGVQSFSSTVYFTNAGAFGTGPIWISSSGTNSSIQLQGTLPVTLTNHFIPTNVNFNLVGNAAGLTLSGPWTLATTPNIGCGGNGNLVTISGVMSGIGGFCKYNPSTLVLSGANTYSGGTIISNGVLSITDDSNLGTAASNATVNIILSGGTLNASNTFTLSSKRLINLTANSQMSVSIGNTLSYGGVISGGFNLIKSGAGTLALNGANAYTGITTISAGIVEADSQTGSSTGSGNVNISSGATLSGDGVVGGTVSGAGNINPGTAAGPGTLTFGKGLTMSGSTYVWTLSSNSTADGFSQISLIGGNLTLGGNSKLSINFTNSATAPSVTDAFWQTEEEWTVVNVNGAGSNSGSTKFTSILNNNYAAGSFTNFIQGNGSIVLLWQPSSPAFNALYDNGPGFFSGENLILTNYSGLSLSVWSSTNGYLAVSNWTLEGTMTEQSLAPAMPGYSQYSIDDVTPAVSPTFYVAGNRNTGPYNISPVPATIITTPDFVNFNVLTKNVAISTNGVLALLPTQPRFVPNGASYTPTGGFRFQFTADLNQDFLIQSSHDLIIWNNVSTGTVTSVPMTFTDPSVTNVDRQYYRIIISTGY